MVHPASDYSAEATVLGITSIEYNSRRLPLEIPSEIFILSARSESNNVDDVDYRTPVIFPPPKT